MAEATPLPVTDKKEHLHQLIEQHALIYKEGGGVFTFSSGVESPAYFDMRNVSLMPKSASLIGDLLAEKLYHLKARYCGGLESAAIPITAAIIARWPYETDIEGFFIRKKPKEYGTQKLIDGNFSADKVSVVVDDVATTGGSIMKAASALRDEGHEVKDAVVLVDWQRGAKELLAKNNITLHALYGADDFGL